MRYVERIEGSRHIPTLDGWRGVAILAVVICHVRWPFSALLRLSAYGALGVHLFFALSGFLITTRMLQEFSETGELDLRNFYVRRFFRIVPAALTYLIVVAVLGIGLKLIPMDWAQLAASTFLYRNYVLLPAASSWYTGHYWSLAVEEHFYLLWPTLLLLAGLSRGILLAPALACAVAVWRALDIHFGYTSFLGSVERTDYRLDGLLWGCALAFFWTLPHFRGVFEHFSGTLVCALTIGALSADLFWQPPGYLFILPILMALLLASTMGSPSCRVSRLLDTRLLRWIGRISYSIYLWQQLFLPVYGVPAPFGILQEFPINLLAIVGVACISYYAIERPFIELGGSLQRRDSRSVLVQAARSAT